MKYSVTVAAAENITIAEVTEIEVIVANRSEASTS